MEINEVYVFQNGRFGAAILKNKSEFQKSKTINKIKIWKENIKQTYPCRTSFCKKIWSF